MTPNSDFSSMSIIQLSIYVFAVFNSVGAVPVFVSLLARYPHHKQIKIIIRELLIALFILLCFAFFGEDILTSLQVSTSTIGIGGGLLLSIIALNMIFPKPETFTKKDVPAREPFIIPLALPGLAGPASIAAMLILSAKIGPIKTASALAIAWIPSFTLILASAFIKKILGEKGILAVEKIGGMILILLGIEMMTKGIVEIGQTYFLK